MIATDKGRPERWNRENIGIFINYLQGDEPANGLAGISLSLYSKTAPLRGDPSIHIEASFDDARKLANRILRAIGELPRQPPQI